MNPIDLIEKLISEHSSAAIINQQLAFAKKQFAALERKTSELARELSKLEGQLEREILVRDKAQQELQRLQKEHEEETVIYRLLEFRRGKRTRSKWVPFCPVCHAPVGINARSNDTVVYCIGDCSKRTDAGLITYFDAGTTVESLIAEVEKLPH